MAERTLGILWHLYWWGPAAAVAGVIFYFSAQSQWGGYLGELASQIGTKPFHVLAYLTLALTLLRAVHQGRGVLKRRATLKAFLLLVIFSVLDETHQTFIPDRPHYHALVNDVLLDGLCFAVAVVLWQSILGGRAWHNTLRRTRYRRRYPSG